jgi:hypothetical protein
MARRDLRGGIGAQVQLDGHDRAQDRGAQARPCDAGGDARGLAQMGRVDIGEEAVVGHRAFRLGGLRGGRIGRDRNVDKGFSISARRPTGVRIGPMRPCGPWPPHRAIRP